jgi:hypothetical protein
MKHFFEELSFKKFAFGWTILVFVLILIRAALVPISHDEAATFLHYIQQGDFFYFYAHWDANNHALNSLLGIWMYNTFGSELIWLRLPNVLSFLLFAYYGYQIISRLRSKSICIFTFVALTTAWMPFEFFAQCRGYGLGLAFMLPSLFYLFRYFESGKAKDQVAVWGFLSLALFANLSLSNTFLISLGLVFLAFVFHVEKRSLKNILSFVVLGILPFIGFSTVAFTMKEKGLLYYGEGTGFIDVTVRTLSAHTLGTESELILYLIANVAAVSIVILLAERRWLKNFRPNQSQLIALMLFGNIAGTLLLHFILDVNFPEDRVGIYFIPLFVMTFGMAADRLAKHREKLIRIPAIAGLLVFPVVTAANSRFYQVHVWRQIPLDRALYEEVDKQAEKLGRPPMISGYKLFPLSWAYENLKSEAPLPPMTPREYDSGIADFHICYLNECDPLLIDYRDITPVEGEDVRLLERIEKIEFDTLAKSAIDEYIGEAEYFNLLETRNVDDISRTEAIHLDFEINSDLDPCTIDLIITAQDENEGMLYYDFIPLHWVRDQWHGEQLKITRPVKFDDSTKRVICYLWNRNKAKIEVTKANAILLKADIDGI